MQLATRPQRQRPGASPALAGSLGRRMIVGLLQSQSRQTRQQRRQRRRQHHQAPPSIRLARHSDNAAAPAAAASVAASISTSTSTSGLLLNRTIERAKANMCPAASRRRVSRGPLDHYSPITTTGRSAARGQPSPYIDTLTLQRQRQRQWPEVQHRAAAAAAATARRDARACADPHWGGGTHRGDSGVV